MGNLKTLSERIVDSAGTGKADPEELSVLDGLTATVAELNILDTVTATAAELNYLDITTLGTGAASKAVVLDAGDDYTWPAAGILTYGVLKDSAGTTLTATVTELNYAGGVTSAIQTQLNAKAPIDNPTFTGEIGIGAVNVSETELGILEGATVSTAELNVLDGVTATAAEINKAADVSSYVSELTVTGAIPATAKVVELNHISTIIAATYTVVPSTLMIIKNTSASGTAAHTVTLTGGTFNGTATVATLDARDEMLVVYFDSAGRGQVIVNVGTVGLA